MKRAALFLALAPLCLHAQAPAKTDLTLWTGLATVRTFDWTTTRECLSRPWRNCHEAELPQALAHSRPGMAAFETATLAGGIEGQEWLAHRGHVKLARWLQLGSVLAIGGADLHNWRLSRRQP